VPSTKSCWKAFEGELSAGSGTPLADQESDSLPVPRMRLGKRVCVPMLLGDELVDGDRVLEIRRGQDASRR
jgi:hypothetical protein